MTTKIKKEQEDKIKKIMKYAGKGKIDEKYNNLSLSEIKEKKEKEKKEKEKNDKKFYDCGLEIRNLKEFLE